MTFVKFNIITTIVLICVFMSNMLSAEPFIVLKFSHDSEFSNGDGENLYNIDPDYSQTYKVQSGDSVNSIMNKFYKGSGLDKRFVQLAILISNRKAFARNNPNFLYSGKTIHLPGKNQIEKLLVGKPINRKSESSEFGSNRNIYFFGG